jgi:hypothetical protein
MEQLGLLFFMLLGYAEQNWIVVTVFIIGALVLNGLALSKSAAFFSRSAFKLTVIGFGGVFALLFVLLPGLTGSGFGYMGYWLDWVLLGMMSAGYAAALVLWIYPAVTLYQAQVKA